MNKLIIFTIITLFVGCFFDSEDYPPLPDLVAEDLYGCWSLYNEEEACTKVCFDESSYLYYLRGQKAGLVGVSGKRSWEMLGRYKVNGGGGYYEEKIITLNEDGSENSFIPTYYFPSNEGEQGSLENSVLHIARSFYVIGDSLMYRGSENSKATVYGTRLASMNAACHESFYYFSKPEGWTLE